MNDRQRTGWGVLARSGFVDPERAQINLNELVELPLFGSDAVAAIVEEIGASADPDTALQQFVRLMKVCDAVQGAALASDEAFRARVVDVLGASEALGDFLIKDPGALSVLIDAEMLAQAPSAKDARTHLLLAVGALPDSPEPVASVDRALDELRLAYRRWLLGIAVRDLCGLAGMEAVATWLSDLADATLEAALAIARAEVGEAAFTCRLAVIGMGKCGGRELNYISDVDVIFVAEAVEGIEEADALRAATSLASAMMRACSTTTSEGSIWEVDAALRPEGKQGALVRTLPSHVGYYQRWASTWEFQALLKARHCAGDIELGNRYVDEISQLVWTAADRPDFVSDVQAMRRRVEDNIARDIADRELKLGPGGLRDVEFSVQLLQLVHGRSDVMLRSPTTLVALEALATWGYVGRADASALADAYRFLRTLEHRLQLRRLRRTHTLPDDDAELRVLARSIGLRAEPVRELLDQWKTHQRQVRRLHEKLFYRPLLQSVARLEAGEARLSLQAAEERLQALGYADPAGAIRHLQALTSGVSRRAAIQKTLLPVMLGWFADGPDPDAGLLGFRQVSDALGATPWYLRLLRDESVAAERLAFVMSASRYATDLLLRAPESVQMLADDDDLKLRTLEALGIEALALVQRQEDPVAAVAAVRGLRRRELFRIAVANLLGVIGVDQVGPALSSVAIATVQAAFVAAQRKVIADGPTLSEVSVIAMGRFGGRELGFASDLDVMFVQDPVPGADETQASKQAMAIAEELRSLLMSPSSDPPVDLDADLRPEGKAGPLVRSLASYRAYYERWSSPWEAQALLRATPIAGSSELGARFVELIDPLRYPAGGLEIAALREARRLKARMEAERLPRGADPTLHTKLGRGGLSDVEWTVQLLQMEHAAEYPSLRTTSTLEGLEALVSTRLMKAQDAETLRTSWMLATSVRDAVMLVKGRSGDSLPSDVAELSGLAAVLRPGSAPTEVLDEYLRVTRRARAVMERIFYGEE
ncbi:MAG: bifunctional [glutamine synthetase] adenylyltransferase/[glutamine synthetase]-adenylyl-L-tyrosine phosphorylase [Actinomycetota bacterium]|nr:bifunctional [glutamine synthetase] adenylyltransferase/[glutamine synthetase]-adenylyl-L-tyrosine phosphorylase [Actinomycetota bacterium]